MAKTFEEWFEEIFDDLEDWNPYDLMKKAWDASRQNMTTTPGLSFCKDCGGPYSLHHDCKCGNCNG